MARSRRTALAMSFSLFVACNAILGNESEYTLVPPDVGEGGAAGAGVGGAAGDSSTGGDGTAGDSSTGGDGTAGATQGGAAGGPSNTGGEVGSGGSAGSAGASGGGDAGAGGSGPCVPTGSEDCFNGKDDDCNGATDCADTACTAGAVCVPAPAGATIGTYALPAAACPTGYGVLTLRRGLTANPTCDGCSCTPNDSRCESGIYGHGTYPCPSYQFNGQLYNSFSDRCQPFSGDTSVHFYAVRGFTTCTAVGTATVSPASWGETQDICTAKRVGAGCGSGSVCAPKVTTPHCVVQRGAKTCAGNYPTSTGDTWYTGSTDTRSCSACSCAFGSATCTGAKIQVFESVDCSGAGVDLDSGAEGDNCAVSIAAHSSRVSGTATNGSCEPNAYPSGELTETDPRTVCCE